MSLKPNSAVFGIEAPASTTNEVRDAAHPMLPAANSDYVVRKDLLSDILAWMRVVVSELSGRGNVLSKAEELGVHVSEGSEIETLKEIKEAEARGVSYESAEASVALLLGRKAPDYQPRAASRTSMVMEAGASMPKTSLMGFRDMVCSPWAGADPSRRGNGRSPRG
jgi:hypothetical protein